MFYPPVFQYCMKGWPATLLLIHVFVVLVNEPFQSPWIKQFFAETFDVNWIQIILDKWYSWNLISIERLPSFNFFMLQTEKNLFIHNNESVINEILTAKRYNLVSSIQIRKMGNANVYRLLSDCWNGFWNKPQLRSNSSSQLF